MTVLVVANFSDRRCGFQNFAQQTVTALARAGVAVTAWDGTYSQIYARREAGEPTFFPVDVETYDVVHVIWHAATLNHYSGADWPRQPRISWWDGGPGDATCPFAAAMHIRWSSYPRPGYHTLDGYPVPDWVTDQPDPDPVFTVGVSSVRGDGVDQIRAICRTEGWALNAGDPAIWLSVEDEIRRLARSTLNVCWYRTSPIWPDLASAPSMLLAAGRPILINQDALLRHLHGASDLYHGLWDDDQNTLAADLQRLATTTPLTCPTATAARHGWAQATDQLLAVWKDC